MDYAGGMREETNDAVGTNATDRQAKQARNAPIKRVVPSHDSSETRRCCIEFITTSFEVNASVCHAPSAHAGGCPALVPNSPPQTTEAITDSHPLSDQKYTRSAVSFHQYAFTLWHGLLRRLGIGQRAGAQARESAPHAIPPPTGPAVGV
jgi:hypothetical protein